VLPDSEALQHKRGGLPDEAGWVLRLSAYSEAQQEILTVKPDGKVRGEEHGSERGRVALVPLTEIAFPPSPCICGRIRVIV
jgi:hypothetical protein